MATNTIPSPCPKTNLTRRDALAGTAAIGALALPAGAAVAAVSDADPGLALIEPGYRRWQALHAEKERLLDLASELCDRARADRPMLEPEPPIPEELLPYTYDGQVWYGTVPEELKAIGGKHQGAMMNWRHASIELLEGHPDYEKSGDLEAEADDLRDQAYELRDELLKIPARSPRTLLIKFAIAVDAKRLEDIETAIEQSDFTDDLRLLAPDLRAMVDGAGAA